MKTKRNVNLPPLLPQTVDKTASSRPKRKRANEGMEADTVVQPSECLLPLQMSGPERIIEANVIPSGYESFHLSRQRTKW